MAVSTDYAFKWKLISKKEYLQIMCTTIFAYSWQNFMNVLTSHSVSLFI